MKSINQILQDSVDQIRSALQQLQPEPFIESLPSVLIEDEEVYRRLPEDVSAVYFLTHPYEELLYLGKANDLRTRWRPSGHTHDCLDPTLQLRDVKLAWWALDVDLLSAVEEVLTKAWRPLWNGGAKDWIKRYRPEWNWPDDITDRQITDSERSRGQFTKGSARLNDLWRKQHAA